MTTQDISRQFSLDVNGLTDLKRQVREKSPQGIKAAAQQFEALFLQMVLKSMRDAMPREGMFDSEQSRMYESLLDQQLTQVLSTKGRGVGLAALIEKQLSQTKQDPQVLEDLPLLAASPPIPLGVRNGLPLSLSNHQTGLAESGVHQTAEVQAPTVSGSQRVAPTIWGSGSSRSAREFVNQIWPHAYEVSQTTGIPAHFMVAQAALETGWGKSEPHFADGRSSHNLFGIKAGKNWTGPVLEATTTEFVQGVEQKQLESFRAYSSYAEAFRDYAQLLTANPRYAAVLGSQDASRFARGLQQAGYATDPMYASKLERIIAGNTLRSSLAG